MLKNINYMRGRMKRDSSFHIIATIMYITLRLGLRKAKGITREQAIEDLTGLLHRSGSILGIA